MADPDLSDASIANPRDLPPPKALRRRASPDRDIKTAKESLAIKQANSASTATKVARTGAVLGVTILLFVGLFFLLSAVESDTSGIHAPWANPSAPNVVPLPIGQQ